MEHQKLYKILIIIAIFLVGFTLGCYANSFIVWSLGGQSTANTRNNDAFLAGWQAAKDKLMSVGFFKTGNEASLTGYIKEINNQSIVFSVNSLNPLGDQLRQTRTALINQNTMIVLRQLMNKEELAQAEKNKAVKLAQLNDKLKLAQDETEKNNLTIEINVLEVTPLVYKEVPINFGDLKVGYTVIVNTNGNTANEEFQAKKIVVIEENSVAPADANNVQAPL